MRAVGTVLFLWLILRNVDLGTILSLLGDLSGWLYGVVLGMFLVNQFLTALRWKILLKVVNVQIPLLALYKVVLYGQVLSRILPSTIGGDTARIGYLLAGQPDQKSESVSATLMDRVLGLFALMTIVLITLPFAGVLDGKSAGWLFLSLGLVLGISLYLVYGHLGWLISFVKSWKILQTRLGLRIKKWVKTFLKYRENKAGLAVTFILSLVIQVILVLGQYLTFIALGVQVPLKQLFVAIPLVSLITVLPISLGGLGLREASLAALLNIESNAVLSYTLVRYSISVFLTAILLLETIYSHLVTRFHKRS